MQKLTQNIALVYHNLGRLQRLMLISFAFLILFFILLQTLMHSPQKKMESRVSHIPSTSSLPQDTDFIDQSDQSKFDETPEDELNDQEIHANNVQEHVIASGDTLGTVLAQYGIDISDIALLSANNPALRHLKTGQEISWKINGDGNLEQLTWRVSRSETRIYDRLDHHFKETQILQKGEWRSSLLNGHLDGNFINSAKKAGLNASEIHAVVKALQWKLDFNKLQKNDPFFTLFSREYLNGENNQSRLLGVRIFSGGKNYYAIRDEDGLFYDEKGESLAQGFMRFPTLKQFKVSSGFNPKRLNPVTNRILPHKGVDFSMPIGTPILATGDGEILVAKHTGAAGNLVTIRHGRQYSTRYMHLNKLLVKPGQKVKRGDRIALSGNTGRSTGPHLHYEFWINQQPVNPITVKLPATKNLTGSALRHYLQMSQNTIAQLNSI